MALTNCNDCGKPISTKAEFCTGCGMVLKTSYRFLLYFSISLSIIVALFVMGWVSMGFVFTKSVPDNRLQSESIHVVTIDKYLSIQYGVSYQEVVEILGAEGEELSSNRVEGIPGVMESLETMVFQWVNENGSKMNATFQNNELTQKGQSGLK